MALVEFFHCRLEVRALLAFDEELSNLGAPLHILWSNFAHLAFFSGTFAFHVRRSERIVWELAFVLGLGDLGFGMPELSLLVRHVLPREPNDLGKGAVVGLDLGRDVTTFNE